MKEASKYYGAANIVIRVDSDNVVTEVDHAEVHIYKPHTKHEPYLPKISKKKFMDSYTNACKNIR